MKRLWTLEAYTLLYETLTKRVGPYSTWKDAYSPGGERNEEFLKVCEGLAALIGAKSEAAVRHQIYFALPVKEGKRAHWPPSHARTAILNISAAFWAGFIEFRDLPELVAVPPNENETFVDGTVKTKFNPDV